MTQLWPTGCEGRPLGVLSKISFPNKRATGGETLLCVPPGSRFGSGLWEDVMLDPATAGSDCGKLEEVKASWRC